MTNKPHTSFKSKNKEKKLLNFGFLHSLTLGELISKRFIAEEDSREWQGICTPKNLKTSDKVSVDVLDFVRDEKKADYYKVEKIPATIVEGEEDYGLRF